MGMEYCMLLEETMDYIRCLTTQIRCRLCSPLELHFGDMCVEFVRRTFEGAPPPVAECSAISRMQRVRDVSAYSTKAALGGGWREQQIVISCEGDDTSGENSKLSISVMGIGFERRNGDGSKVLLSIG
ncbi:hypothetical protein Cni_G06104 [Canna indica]|uniref:Uncharacterized protein n=1 Tax=Canna indica TaxID=4628 RepID=A0AAQ3JWC2_9LILI|nr:hypothetical protein Cni_G06104 [Canna indica]